MTPACRNYGRYRARPFFQQASAGRLDLRRRVGRSNRSRPKVAGEVELSLPAG